MTEAAFTFEEFEVLCLAIKDDLKRVASGTRGDYTFGDLRSEAWLEACKLLESGQHDSIFSPDFQNHLIARLYLRLCKSTNATRFAYRIDDTGDGDSNKNHWIEAEIASSNDDPAVRLIRIEERQKEEPEQEKRLNSSYSEAIAYFRFLQNFNSERKVIAKHLSLSWNWIWRKMKRASAWAKQQCSLFDNEEIIAEDFVPPPSRLKRRETISRKDRSKLKHQQRLMQQMLIPRMYVPIGVVER